MKLLVLDPGHGGQDPGAVYQTMREKALNLEMARRVREFLEKNYEVRIVMTREGDTTVSLEARTNLANSLKSDYYISIHYNAGGGTGFESYRFNGAVSNQTNAYQQTIHKEVASIISGKYKRRDRGTKSANFHVLRETNMPAVLLEVLFIDNEGDRSLILNETFKKEVSISIANGIAKALSLPRKTNNTIFKVIAGSFKNRENAIARVERLQKNNIEAFIAQATLNGAPYFRVQTGAFSERENSEQMVQTLTRLGIEAFIIAEENESTSPPPPSPTPKPMPPAPPPQHGFSILGSSVIYAKEMDTFVQTIHPNAPALGELYERIGRDYGIRGDVAFAQAIHETNYFRFTGIVKPEQNNYAGIGATGGDVTGASFATPEEGVLAHIQHLYAYASRDPLPDKYPKVDPRFDLVTRGSAPGWKDLNGRWAVPGSQYGQLILKIYEKNLEESITVNQMELETMREVLGQVRNAN
ncbi:N-acetylmuramoyl-L-alanine amidase [Sutcliffiella deserti]|uniref:N-acetylmuramoyl-L-alanine amidase n=1 Tax=Sutcliffiella deserti TaxID=2875501 RepID=UPI001CC08841|nr:N-acetylmuramoyl-L-alanine amidase [Sutcliffiella deserti]